MFLMRKRCEVELTLRRKASKLAKLTVQVVRQMRSTVASLHVMALI